MADLRARRKVLRGAEIQVVELVFDHRTSGDPDNTGTEDEKKKIVAEVCLQHLKDQLKILPTDRAGEELAVIGAREK